MTADRSKYIAVVYDVLYVEKQTNKREVSSNSTLPGFEIVPLRRHKREGNKQLRYRIASINVVILDKISVMLK